MALSIIVQVHNLKTQKMDAHFPAFLARMALSGWHDIVACSQYVPRLALESVC